MSAAWIVDTWVFMALLLWSLAWPRNEWMGNSLAVVGGMALVLWYQPAMPALLLAADGAGPLTYPLHRLLGFLALIGVLWTALQAWEDFKEARAERKRRDQVSPDGATDAGR